MLHILISLAAVSLGGLMLWGWGWAALRCARAQPLTFPLTITLGLAAVLFIGGALNLARIAFPLSLDAVVLIGVILAITGWSQSGRPFIPRPNRPALWAGIPLLLAAACFSIWFIPQEIFNHHDDLEKYFSHPFKMLATGTFPPNPLGSLGAESLGGQAFLQGFALAHFPIPYIGSVDGVFCLLLCMTLAGFAIKPDSWVAGAIAAEFLVLTINPQIVNISAVYSGAALMIAAIFLTGISRDNTERETPSSPVLLGLLYSGLLALKTTLCVFVGIHLLMLTVLGMIQGQRRLRWAIDVSLWTFLFLVPWLVLHLPLYLEPVQHATAVRAVDWHEPFDFFSTEQLFYGATALHYTAMALAGPLVAGLAFVLRRRHSLQLSNEITAALAASLTCFLAYIVLIVVFGPLLFGTPTARYACPVFIGTLPAAIRLLGSMRGLQTRQMLFGTACLTTIIVAAFIPSSVQRINLIAREGNPLAFFLNQSSSPVKLKLLSDYNREVLAGPVRSNLRQIQALVPKGEPLGAWVMAPFWFDFNRNPVFHAEPAGLAMRWARLPPTTRYFLLEYGGSAVTSIRSYESQLNGAGFAQRLSAARSLAFLSTLEKQSAKSEILYNDGRYILMRMPTPFPPVF